MIDKACEADLVIKHSGVGVDDALLEKLVLECRSANTQVAFWDVDAPATLASVEANALHPFRALIPEYDYIFTYGGGPPVVDHYERLGARACHPIYNALDPQHTIRFHPGRSVLATCCLSAIGCLTVSGGSRSSSSPQQNRRPSSVLLSAAKVGAANSCRTMSAGWATSGPAITIS